MNEKLILLVEDDEKLNDFNKQLLQGQGFTVKTAATLSEARGVVKEQPPNAIILDIGMPDGDGRDFLRELRQALNIPVLLLTGYKKDADILSGYDSGCDDYVIKPYTFAVLLAKLKRLLQSAEQMPETVTKERLTLKITPMIALVDGEDILLSQKEFALLQFFIQHENRCLTPEHIYEQVWGQPAAGDTKQVKYQVYNLRRKLTGSGFTVASTRNEGYCFERE